MNINYVTTMQRVGEVVKKPGHDKRLEFTWDEGMTKEMQRDERGRVYALCANGDIQKIGGSQAKGGIAATYGAYFSGFAKGMSARTYCVWHYMTKCIAEGKKVEVYCVWAPLVKVTIPTMNSTITKEMPIDYHTIENAFVHEFVDKEGRFPYLNMQESGGRWQDTGLLEGYGGLWVPEGETA